jgi:hypothetical protein
MRKQDAIKTLHSMIEKKEALNSTEDRQPPDKELEALKLIFELITN